MQVSRRGFLTGLIALSATALAAKLSLPSTAMAEEVRSELIKDLNRSTVAMPGQAEPVWASVSGTASFWTDEIISKYKDNLILSRALVENMSRELARRIDKDLMDSMVPKEKQLIVGMPQATVTNGGRKLELRAGLVKQDTIWGEEFRVEYIRPTELIIPGLDKRGQAEYAGLILPSSAVA